MERMRSLVVVYEYSNVVGSVPFQFSCRYDDVYSFDVTGQLHQHFSFGNGLAQ